MGVHVLDAVELLQLPREVPVHDLHLGLQPGHRENRYSAAAAAPHSYVANFSNFLQFSGMPVALATIQIHKARVAGNSKQLCFQQNFSVS